jgi:hypothetical protein
MRERVGIEEGLRFFLLDEEGMLFSEGQHGPHHPSGKASHQQRERDAFLNSNLIWENFDKRLPSMGRWPSVQ